MAADVRLGTGPYPVGRKGRDYNHAVALRPVRTTAPFPRDVAEGAALCGATGDLPEPQPGLFGAELTCPACSAHVRGDHLTVQDPSERGHRP